MSLFDVIRYPVTDFLNQEEMDPIPTTITKEWARVCLLFLTGEDLPKEEHSSYGYGLVVFKHMMIASKNRYDTMDDKFMEICKYYFLTMLKARIRDA